MTTSKRLLAASLDEIPIKQLSAKKQLDVRIDDVWYDLSGWRKAHPSGEHWIDLYKDRDATEVMHGFHSEKGRKMFRVLPKSKRTAELEQISPPVSQLTRNFRVLRQQLEEEGWWKRNYFHEARLITIWGSFLACGILTAKSMPILAVILLSIANTAAGWIGHDYVHGVDKMSFAMRNFAALAGGLLPTWWSDKHNKHHALTNEIGVDEDLATEPFLYIYSPNPTKDSFLRKIQHIVFPLPMSALFHLWRFDSLKLSISDALNGFKRKTQYEFLSLIIHYSALAYFVPLPVILGFITLSGLMTAIIVTVTHQSEELFEEHNPDFVDAQFRSTRNAKCSNFFSDWLWGGMQWQLEHHLFPSMPRSKYPALSKILQKFAVENNVEYRMTDEFELLYLNWQTYAKISSVPTTENAKHFEGKDVNWGGRGEVVL